MVSLKDFFEKMIMAVNPKKGSSLVLLGGNTGNSEHADTIYKKIVELAGGKKGKIGIITSANKPYGWDCKDSGESTDGGCNDPTAKNSKMAANRYIDRFKQYGIRAEWIPIDVENKMIANDRKLAQRIAEGEFSGFFFGGGKQTYHVEALYRGYGEYRSDSLVLAEIRARFDSGQAVIAGTSAGAVVQSSDIMILGGKSNHALVYGAHEENESGGSKLKYAINEGFGFFNYGILDSHFSQRGREGRSIRLASDTGSHLVFGIDEATALVVTQANKPYAKMEVIGQNGVQIFDLMDSLSKLNDQGLWSIKDVQSTYLTKGDKYIPSTNRVIFHSDKRNIRKKEVYRGELKPSKDIFSSGKGVKSEFINTALNLVNCSDINTATGYARTKKVKYKVTFKKTEQTESFFIDKNNERIISYRNMKITIRPVSEH